MINLIFSHVIRKWRSRIPTQIPRYNKWLRSATIISLFIKKMKMKMKAKVKTWSKELAGSAELYSSLSIRIEYFVFVKSKIQIQCRWFYVRQRRVLTPLLYFLLYVYTLEQKRSHKSSYTSKTSSQTWNLFLVYWFLKLLGITIQKDVSLHYILPPLYTI